MPFFGYLAPALAWTLFPRERVTLGSQIPAKFLRLASPVMSLPDPHWLVEPPPCLGSWVIPTSQMASACCPQYRMQFALELRKVPQIASTSANLPHLVGAQSLERDCRFRLTLDCWYDPRSYKAVWATMTVAPRYPSADGFLCGFSSRVRSVHWPVSYPEEEPQRRAKCAYLCACIYPLLASRE
jgi:hypothetical protein